MKKSEAEDLTAWDQYQHSKIGNNVEERIRLFDLESYTGTDKTLLDTGANNGKFTAIMANLFQSATAVEPYAKPVPQPSNVTWIKKGFKDFCESNTQRFDVVYSFAMTIQVADIDLMDTDAIAMGYYNLTAEDGVLIYETQKLSKPRHKDHAMSMIASFRKMYGKEFRTGKGRSRDTRTVHYFRRAKA